MSEKKQEVIETYINDLLDKIGVDIVDGDLLEAVVTGLGPSVYNDDASTVASSDEKECETVKKNFMIKKLGLDEEKDDLDEALQTVIEMYGTSTKKKYRAVIYYLLTKHFKKEYIYFPDEAPKK